MMIEYMCSHCGKKVQKSPFYGRPLPGACPRREKFSNGLPKPHVWVINRKIGN